MKNLHLYLLAGLFSLTSLAYSGDDVDTSGPTPTPPTDSAPASSFTESDCDKKIAALNESHQEEIGKKDAEITGLKASLEDAEKRIETLLATTASLKQELADATTQAETPEPATETETETVERETGDANSMAWLPWIIALILAVVGFLIGRGTAGGSDSSSK